MAITEEVLVEKPPGAVRALRTRTYTHSWSDDLLVAMTLATDKMQRESPGYELAGFTWVRRVSDSLAYGVHTRGVYCLTTYWDAPNAALDTLNPRNLNNAEQYVLGQLVEGADADRLAVGTKENRF